MLGKQHFGALIRSLRQGRKEPLRVVAAEVGIDSTLLCKLERGERLPTETQIARFARIFQRSETELKGLVIADRMLAEYDDTQAAVYAAQFIREEIAPYVCAREGGRA
jgi:transcriptional regulator with XRE-family HTH domain